MTLTSEQDKMQTQLAAHFKTSFSAHGTYLTFRDKKVLYYDVSGQNRLYLIVLQQNNALTANVFLTIAL